MKAILDRKDLHSAVREAESLGLLSRFRESEAPDQGEQSFTFFRGDRVFKCPKGDTQQRLAKNARGMRREVQALEHLGRTGAIKSVAIPKIIGRGRNYNYIVESRVTGTDIGSLLESGALPEKDGAAIGEKIGHFIHEFSGAFPPETIQPIGFTSSLPFLPRELPEEVGKLFSVFGEDFYGRTVSRYIDSAEKMELLPFHGDLFYGNILYQNEGEAGVAITDFGDIRLGSITTAFARLPSKEILSHAVLAYEKASGAEIDIDLLFCEKTYGSILWSDLLGDPKGIMELAPRKYSLDDCRHIAKLNKESYDACRALLSEHGCSRPGRFDRSPAVRVAKL